MEPIASVEIAIFSDGRLGPSEALLPHLPYVGNHARDVFIAQGEAA